jgi:hypothetical protein
MPKLNVANRIFGLGGEHQLAITGDDVVKFDAAIEDLLDFIQGVRTTLSAKKITLALVEEIRTKKIGGTRFDEAESQSFEQKILALPLKTRRVLREIYGVFLPPNSDPVKMGNFTIYDANSHSAQFARGLSDPNYLNQPTRMSGFMIECEVNARDDEKAAELAHELFYRLELIIRFFIGVRTTRFEVGVINYVGPQQRDHVVICENRVTKVAAWQGALEPLSLADPFFCNPSPPFARLLKIMEGQSNQFERHILRCAEWTAQAIGDPNAASALVKAAIALEVLFSGNEKGVITPSIMAQIAESCAFLLGVSASSAVEIEREVKRLYGVRSSVVHSGKDSVETSDLDGFIGICRNVVLTILSSDELEGIETIEKLSEYFKTKRYSSVKPHGT